MRCLRISTARCEIGQLVKKRLLRLLMLYVFCTNVAFSADVRKFSSKFILSRVICTGLLPVDCSILLLIIIINITQT